MKGISLNYMMSMANVMVPYHSKSSSGNADMFSIQLWTVASV